MEFIGPVAIAALGSRTVRDLGGLLLAVLGIVLLGDVRWDGHALGVVFAIGAGVLWAGYIVLGKIVADGKQGIDGLAVGLCGAALVTSPMALTTGPVWHSPNLLLFAIAVGVLSSALPYALDQVVLVRMGRDGFALLLAILPATAAAIGVVVLRQIPTPVEVVGIALVIVAVWVSQSRWRANATRGRGSGR
ncbi:EamA-like transporter family protein [Antricoccus suffuscus]|uniref:EamA-like transporter family protein n=1 Tax=Antricoccus suffuscus TaxID=1629062 RepID=A0A2T1A4X9_9ACTN|nr:EamA family transporter [Antricoccus suffuscus]PRZ43652.1 EamA-like transporter family protein [Antricoccus suffuscus]